MWSPKSIAAASSRSREGERESSDVNRAPLPGNPAVQSCLAVTAVEGHRGGPVTTRPRSAEHGGVGERVWPPIYVSPEGGREGRNLSSWAASLPFPSQAAEEPWPAVTAVDAGPWDAAQIRPRGAESGEGEGRRQGPGTENVASSASGLRSELKREAEIRLAGRKESVETLRGGSASVRASGAGRASGAWSTS